MPRQQIPTCHGGSAAAATQPAACLFPLVLPLPLHFILLELSRLTIHPLGWRRIKCMKGSKTQKNLSKQLYKNVLVQNSSLNYIIIKDTLEDTIRIILSEHFNKWTWLFFSHFLVVFINFLNILIFFNVSSKRNLIVEKNCWAGFSLSNSQWKFSLAIWPYI